MFHPLHNTLKQIYYNSIHHVGQHTPTLHHKAEAQTVKLTVEGKKSSVDVLEESQAAANFLRK